MLTTPATPPGVTGCTPPAIPNPGDEGVRNRINTSDSYVSTATLPRPQSFVTPVQDISASAPATLSVVAKQAVANAPTEVAAMKQLAPIVGNSVASVKTVPSIKTNGSDKRLSHHAVRSNANVSSSVPNAPLSGEVVSLNTIATFPAAGKSITIKYSATVNTPPLARRVL